ncbi:MAG: peptidoglycan bridge formation glycyltransferase FemA/FemB family protein [Acutalibacteraceae bacterium]|nr:peptidoglycan bridge formation glycyltransferase FemA/FemB family protein [Acutalibacteraceae bacterium]
MKTQIIDINSAAEFDAFTEKHKNGHFLQTSLWARVKDDWKWFGVICRNDSGEITGTMGVLLRKISKLPFHMMYAPRGPVCDFDDKETFSALIEAAKQEGKKYNAYELKIDKDVPVDNEDYKATALAKGFKFKERTINFEDFQCRYVIRILLDGRNEDEVFAAFHSDHRRKIRIALKNNVEIKIHGSEMAQTFYEIMKETCERDGFELRSAAYFAKILDCFGDKARLYMAYYEGRPIAGAISVLWGDKVWYFYGASSNSDRKVMPNYLMQWEMIKWAIESGCSIYDFRGVAGVIDESNPLFGLYRFKHRFDGTYIEFMGEMDLITKPAAAKIVAASQEILKKLR